jgi:hypothetical protein
MRSIRQIAANVWLVFMAANAGWAGTNEFQRQTITIPGTPHVSGFADIDNDGLLDLLAVGPAENTLWIYRQRASGFADTPDQVIQLPPQTAWIALCDVDAHPGLELLMSTATGLVYLRQNRGVFESQPRTLVGADQVFTNGVPTLLTSFAGQKDGTNDVIPVISANQAVLYQRNSAFEWSPGPPMPLHPTRTYWNTNRGEWMLASTPSHSIHIRQSFRANPEDNLEKKPENGAVRKILQDMENMETRGAGWHQHGMDRVDVNGDGREDLVLWQLTGDPDPKTDVIVFLRDADNRLPEQPTQVLHCRGFPIPVGPKQRLSPMGDLNGDGRCELVLVTLKLVITSWSSMLEAALSHGVDWELTIRSFHRDGFSRSPDASIPMTTMLPDQQGPQRFFLIDGDFNGDGRRDVLVKRSPTQWDVFLSSTNGSWFTPQPGLTFEIPMEGLFEIKDLNGDGVSDLVAHAGDEPRLFIFLSQSHRTKGTNP